MRAFYSKMVTELEQRFRFDAGYFLKGGFWLSAGQGFVLLFGLITTAILAHYLSETEYGIYRYLIGLAGIISAFSLTGLGQSIIQAAAKGFHSFYNETLQVNLISNLFLMFAAISCSAYYLYNNNLILSLGCFFIALLQPLINVFQYVPNYLLGRQKYKEAAILQTFKMFFVSLSCLVALFLSSNILFLFFAYLASNAITNYLSFLWYRKDSILSTTKENLDLYVSYAKNTSVRNVITLVSMRIDAIIIFTQLGATQLAIYSIAIVVPDQIKGSLKNLSALLIPKYINNGNYDQIIKGVPKRTLGLFFILFFITILYIVIAPFLYGFLFPKYTDAVFYSQLYSLGFLTHILYIPNSILQARMEERKLYYLSIFGAIFLIALLFTLIPLFGIVGAIMSTLIYRVIFTALTFLLLPRVNNPLVVS